MVEHPTRKHPFGTRVIIILQILSILGLVIDYREAVWRFSAPLPELIGNNEIAILITLIAVLYQSTVTVGLILLRRWAWLLFMVQLGLGMAFDLWAYFNDTPLYASMVISVLMVFYLNQRDVQQAFGHGRGAGEIT